MKLYISVFLGFILLILATVFGVHLNLYGTVPQIDKLFHVAGGAIVAAAALSWFGKDIERTPRSIAILFAIGIAAIIGIFWEVAEATSERFAKDAFPLFYKYFHGGGLWDTLGDLIVDMVGGLALALAWLRHRRKN